MYMPEEPAFRWGVPTGCCPGHGPEKSVWAVVTCAALCMRLRCLPVFVLAVHLSELLLCPEHSTIPKGELDPLQPFPVHLTEDTHQCHLQHLQAIPAPDES